MISSLKHAVSRRLSRNTRRITGRSQRRGGLSLEALEERRLLAAWRPQGPSPIENGGVETRGSNDEVVGAIQTVVAHPTDVDVLYIGGVNGGVWKTSNATSSFPHWEPLGDDLSSLSIGAMDMDPADPNRLIVGSGRFSNFGDGGQLAGVALTEDGGETWTQFDDPLLVGENFTAVAVRGDILVAASRGGGLKGTASIFDTFSSLDDGGIFRSADGGLTWTSIELAQRDPLRLDEPIPFNVFDMVGDPNSPNRFYAAVGQSLDLSVPSDPTGQPIGGIYRSDDAGQTWINISRNDPTLDGQINTVTPAPNILPNVRNDNTRMAVASDGRLYVGVVVGGSLSYIAYTETGGSIWVAMTLPNTPDLFAPNDDPNQAVITNQGLHPRDQGVLNFSIVADPVDPDLIYVGGDGPDGVPVFFDSELLPIAPNGLERDIGCVIGDFICATQSGGRLFRGNSLAPPVQIQFADAAGTVRVDPISMQPLFVSPQWSHLTNGLVTEMPNGGTASGTTPHPDSRGMAFDANGDLIQVDDGGIYRRTSPRTNRGDWFSLNGDLQVSELHSIAYDSVSDILIAGTWDHGVVQQKVSGGTVWEQVVTLPFIDRPGGDGGKVVVDDTSTPGKSIRYISSQTLGNFRRQTFDAHNNLIDEQFLVPPPGLLPFVTPVVLNDVDPKRLVIGSTDGIYESLTRGDSFLPAMGLPGPPGLPPFRGVFEEQDAFAYGGRRNGVPNPDILYVGSGNAVLVRPQRAREFDVSDPFGTLRFTEAPFPGTEVIDIVLDPDDWMTAFVMDATDVYITRNMGASWRKITGNFPSLDAGRPRSLEYLPASGKDAVLVGADTGVFFATTDNLGHWSELSVGLPNTVVFDMEYDRVDDVLAIAALGRGAWVLDNASSEVDGTVPGPLPNTISGIKWNDLNANGRQDPGEPGLFNRTVYIDVDGNGSLDDGEPFTLTNGNGFYALSNVPAGTHVVAEVVPPGWQQTFPGLSGGHRIRVSNGVGVTGVNFGNRLLPGGISGTMFYDVNQDTIRDPDEPGVAGLIAFVDVNDDGLLGMDEPRSVTDSNGNYVISNVPEGSHIIRQTITPGWLETSSPTTQGLNPVTIVAGQKVTGINFGHSPQFDFGDAPAPFPTLAASNGPVHGTHQGMFLGRGVDGDLDGNPSEDADGDGADDDGVIFLTGLAAGETAEVAVIATQFSVSPGYLHAWIDFNGNGSWDDPGEQIFRNQRLADGPNILTIDVPASATLGPTVARFRWAVERELSYDGPSLVGEVEDYAVTIPMEPDMTVMVIDDGPFDVDEDTTEFPLDVLENDFSPFSASLTITDVGATMDGAVVEIVNGSSLLYSPAPDFFGEEEFTYSVRDDVGGTGTATVTIHVANVNDDPTAVDDEISVSTSTINNVLDVLNNDSEFPDVDETLTIVEVTPETAEGGTVTIGSGGANVLYTPPNPEFIGVDTFAYTVGDGNGGTAEANVTVSVIEPTKVVAIRLETTSLAEMPISTISEGGTFLLRGFVQDLRDEPLGVFSAYLDVTFDANLGVPNGDELTHGGAFSGNPTGTVRFNPDEIDEVGGVDEFPVPPEEPANEFLLFTIPVTAEGIGELTFEGNPADILPLHAVELFGAEESIASARVAYGTATIEITESGAMDDEYTFPEDSQTQILMVLDNDDLGVPVDMLEITEIGDTDSGGTASMASATLIAYTPKPDFFGVETFSYVVSDGQGNSGMATVRVTVTNVNDPPTVEEDRFPSVPAGSVRFALDVLENDSQAPDPDPHEELVITDVGQPSEGGTAVADQDRRLILYTPERTFSGTETFEYTVSDREGLTNRATVSVTVPETENVVRFLFETTNTDGNLIETVSVGSRFILKVSIQDIRPEPSGVFSAYLDVNYDAQFVSPDDGSIDYNDAQFPRAQSGSTAAAGLIDEVGAFAEGGLGGDAIHLFSITLQADNAGTAMFSGDPADILPIHEMLFFDPPDVVDSSLVDYGFTTIDVVQGATFTNPRDPLDVSLDGNVSPIDALLIINDIERFGVRELPAPAVDPGIFPAISSPPPAHPVDVNADGFVSAIDVLLVIREVERINEGFAAMSAPRAPLSAGETHERVLQEVDLEDVTHVATTGYLLRDATNAAPGADLFGLSRDRILPGAVEDSVAAIADEVSTAWREQSTDEWMLIRL